MDGKNPSGIGSTARERASEQLKSFQASAIAAESFTRRSNSPRRAAQTCSARELARAKIPPLARKRSSAAGPRPWRVCKPSRSLRRRGAACLSPGSCVLRRLTWTARLGNSERKKNLRLQASGGECESGEIFDAARQTAAAIFAAFLRASSRVPTYMNALSGRSSPSPLQSRSKLSTVSSSEHVTPGSPVKTSPT